ncbi:MAG: hypothetical protein HYR73_01970 [Candidatus Eisenbacteria bacterium]|nr:hypothetical protein [Candidatus Eisenbacteria bacterium]
MTLRIAALLALLLGTAALLVFLRLLGEGPFVPAASRHLREMKNRTDSPRVIEATSFGGLVALPHDATLEAYSVIERRGVSLEGYVQDLIRSPDDDYHLEIVAGPLRAGDYDTSYVSAEITPRVRRDSRNWTFERLIERFRPILGGETQWPGATRRIRVTGWLLFDWQYDWPVGAGAGKGLGARLTGWEIHPVTRIELWDDAQSRFVDYPR